MNLILFTLIAYLVGSIPFGLLIAKSKGIDIRTQGSGNIGATNVLRVIGKKWGFITLFLDLLKGFIPSFFFPLFLKQNTDLGVLFGIASILGHTFPIYLKFKGGKGVATSAGMLLGVAPVAMGIGFLTWGICMLITRYVSLSSILAAISIIITIWIKEEYQQNRVSQIVLTLIAILVIWLHRTNIQRLLKGTENKINIKKEKNE